MKTSEEIAKSIINNPRMDNVTRLRYVTDLIKQYAKEVAQDALDRAYENADIDHDQNNDDVWGHYVIKESIIETEILTP